MSVSAAGPGRENAKPRMGGSARSAAPSSAAKPKLGFLAEIAAKNAAKQGGASAAEPAAPPASSPRREKRMSASQHSTIHMMQAPGFAKRPSLAGSAKRSSAVSKRPSMVRESKGKSSRT